jgi:cation diffusion facilitator CzcD-associated flavoprotein CzcO
MPSPSAPAGTTHDVLIVGTGFAGIGMAVALQQAGRRDFLLLERAGDVGGVWRDNSYPGAACDVPSHLYSFSFAPNPDWSRVFSTQAEIHAYLQGCVERFELRPRIRLNAEVQAAQWDDASARWTVTLVGGEQLHARVLVTGMGQLSRPAMPKLPGLTDFAGPSFHSARWDHGCDLQGKRVAVIGTGASAIQFVPAIAPGVKQLHVFQRSAPYFLPRADRAYRDWEKALFRHVPGAMKLHRLWIYLSYEYRALAFTRFGGLMKVAVGVPFRRLLNRQVSDPALRKRLTPDHPIGCKRILLSSEYLATMARPNVNLVTAGIRRVTPKGIETDDGQHHDADVLILGTGFAATDFLAPMQVQGRGGVELNQVWSQGAKAYLGVSVPGFPNFFMLYGPNTNLGHNSIVYMLESQVAHVMRCLAQLDARQARTIEVDAERHERYNAHIQARMQDTVWHGCTSWYVDANGHNSTNWPGFTWTYRWLTRHSALGVYHLSPKG